MPRKNRKTQTTLKTRNSRSALDPEACSIAGLMAKADKRSRIRVRSRRSGWKLVLMEQRAKQLMCWFEPFVKLRAPKMFNLRRDPFERADENSNTYWDWVISHAYLLYAMQAIVAGQIENFKKYPPRQKPASFNLDAVLRTLVDAGGGANH